MSQEMENLSEVVSKRISKLIDVQWSDSQEALAKRLGIHQTHVSAIKRGAKLPSLPLAVELARVLKTNLDYVVGNTDNDKPASNVEDQLVIGVQDVAERQLMQEICDTVQHMSQEDQQFALEVIRRLKR